ncbi:uncharacterized protein G2W53_011267 [Senna tora]|uniref:Uncharacterized protein n=1 Tax=Senna tora TaxID=362788 RepID=A0A834X105_9FABA|nr:uncharacterized protein G2W53_011267 [Senna tora]
MTMQLFIAAHQAKLSSKIRGKGIIDPIFDNVGG